LLRKKELDWFYEGGAAAIFPDGLCSQFCVVEKKVLRITKSFFTVPE